MEKDRDDTEEAGADVPWLREMVDDDFLGLFSELSEEIARTTRQLALRAADDPSVPERLIEALRTSILEHNDDTQASVWMALLLGEIREPLGMEVLILGLGGDDETIQEAAGDAMLKMGPPAIDALIDELWDDPSPQLAEAGYRLLGSVGSLHDEGLLERARNFLADQVDREAAKPQDERRLESLFQASALLGDRRMLEVMDRILRERFGGINAGIFDSREMLRENATGSPVVHDALPWVEAHRWLFEEDPEASRVKGRKRPDEEDSAEDEDEGEDDAEAGEGSVDSRLASLYWGLSATVEREGKKPLDARRFLEKPAEDNDEEFTAEDAEERGE
jgi:hypothetical protein